MSQRFLVSRAVEISSIHCIAPLFTCKCKTSPPVQYLPLNDIVRTDMLFKAYLLSTLAPIASPKTLLLSMVPLK